MSTLHRLIGSCYRKTEALLRPVLFQREKAGILRRFPKLQPIMEAFERQYIRVEYGAHDRSLMERIERKLTTQEEFVYGTTPWRSFMKIIDSLELKPDDVFIEPGCGTGHLCFFVNQAFGLKAQGIEVMANFIRTANEIRKDLSTQGFDFEQLKFYNLDFFSCDLSRGSIFYIAGTCFPDDYLKRLIDKIAREAKPGSTVITLTHELEHPAYELSHHVDTLFSWGRDKALVYRLKEVPTSA